MVEIGKVLEEGFNIWKRNLNICMPFVFSTLLSFIFVIFTFGAALLVATPSLFRILEKLPQDSQFPQAHTPTPLPTEVVSQIISEFARNWFILLVAGIISAIILLFINAYFVAGAIGMAKEAHLRGETSLSDMIYYGSKKFLSLLGADIIVGLISLLGVIFLLPSVVFILPYLPYLPPSPGETVPPELILTFLALLFIGIILFVIYTLIISIIFALTRYAVVIEDLRAVEGVKTAFKRFLENKLDVFLMWLIVSIIGGGISIAANFFGNLINLLSGVPVGSLIGIIVSLIVVQPLTVVWWSGFYLRLTPPKETQGTFGWERA